MKSKKENISYSTFPVKALVTIGITIPIAICIILTTALFNGKDINITKTNPNGDQLEIIIGNKNK